MLLHHCNPLVEQTASCNEYNQATEAWQSQSQALCPAVGLPNNKCKPLWKLLTCSVKSKAPFKDSCSPMRLMIFPFVVRSAGVTLETLQAEKKNSFLIMIYSMCCFCLPYSNVHKVYNYEPSCSNPISSMLLMDKCTDIVEIVKAKPITVTCHIPSVNRWAAVWGSG